MGILRMAIHLDFSKRRVVNCTRGSMKVLIQKSLKSETDPEFSLTKTLLASKFLLERVPDKSAQKVTLIWLKL